MKLFNALNLFSFYRLLRIYLLSGLFISSFSFASENPTSIPALASVHSSQNLPANTEPVDPLLIKKNVISIFKSTVFEINQTLTEKQQDFQKNPINLVKYVDKLLIPLWSAQSTLKRLFSKKVWDSFSPKNQGNLVQGFNNTLHRYIQEGFKHYNGQKIEFVKVRLNKKQNYGYLTIKVIPTLIPSFNLDFKIALIAGEWHLYDAVVQGVSYVSFKKDEFRRKYQQQGAVGVIESLKKKNSGFIPSQIQMKEI